MGEEGERRIGEEGKAGRMEDGRRQGGEGRMGDNREERGEWERRKKGG